jgi:hypothetical protein
MAETYFLVTPTAPGLSVTSESNPDILVLIFEGWTGDHLLADVRDYFVSEDLAKSISNSSLTGFALKPAESRKSSDYRHSGSPKNIPRIKQLVVTGIPQQDDFGLIGDADLVISAKALAVIQKHPAQYLSVSADVREKTFEEKKAEIYAETKKRLMEKGLWKDRMPPPA